jgi:hypothetical protein
MNLVVGLIVVLSIVGGACYNGAGAKTIIRRYGAPARTAQEIGKEQRANMAERTHQLKELQESTRLNDERKRISQRSTTHKYGKRRAAKKKRHTTGAVTNHP